MIEEYMRHKITYRKGRQSSSEIITESTPDSAVEIFGCISYAMSQADVTSFSVRKLSSKKHSSRL